MPLSSPPEKVLRSAATRPAVVALLLAACVLPASVGGQGRQADSSRAGADSAAQSGRSRPWYERLSLRGYAQVRYNQLLATNPDLRCEQCDRSIGRGGGLFLRRARLVLSGDVSDRVSIYIQPDFASSAADNLHYGQIRDVYADIALDAEKELRVRIGQSKIPFGWENLQSSSNRLPLDRADALNSALPNERDLAVMLYWAPAHIRERFQMLTDSGLKGSGDYGVLGFAAFNGQAANKPERNQNLHTAVRASYPFRFPNGQIVEVGVQAYTGRYVVTDDQRSPTLDAPEEFADERVAGSFVLYPQPFGLQAEWNVGRGPEADIDGETIRERSLDGGYVQAMYRLRTGAQTFIPFVRTQRFDGGKKAEADARRYRVRETELGIEWLPMRALELTAMYTFSDRTYEDLENPDNRQKGQLLRLQVQLNY